MVCFLITYRQYIYSILKQMGIDLAPHALCIHSFTFWSSVDPEKSQPKNYSPTQIAQFNEPEPQLRYVTTRSFMHIDYVKAVLMHTHNASTDYVKDHYLQRQYTAQSTLIAIGNYLHTIVAILFLDNAVFGSRFQNIHVLNINNAIKLVLCMHNVYFRS